MKQEIIDMILFNGYEKQNYGYKRITENNTHWITVFDDGKIQMYAYYDDDSELGNIYDTGIIQTTAERIALLIEILVKNNL